MFLSGFRNVLEGRVVIWHDEARERDINGLRYFCEFANGRPATPDFESRERASLHPYTGTEFALLESKAFSDFSDTPARIEIRLLAYAVRIFHECDILALLDSLQAKAFRFVKIVWAQLLCAMNSKAAKPLSS